MQVSFDDTEETIGTALTTNELASDGTNPGGILGFHLQFQQVLKVLIIQISLCKLNL